MGEDRLRYAEVAVNSPIAQRGTFSYAIPDDLTLSPGQAVWVPFGSRLLQGVVMELSRYPAVTETREIADVIETQPLLSPAQVKLARWLSEHYLSPLFDAVALMLPPGFERKALTFFSPVSDCGTTDASLTAEQKKLFHFLQRKGRAALGEIEKLLGARRARLVTSQLLRRGLLTKHLEQERVKVRARTIPYLRLAVEVSEVEEKVALLQHGYRSPQQAALLEFLARDPRPVPLAEAKEKVGCTQAVVAALEGKGLISLEKVELRRDPLSHLSIVPFPPPSLTPAQKAVWRPIQSSLLQIAEGRNSSKVFLLHGVTGSGKTEIYLRALAQTAALGKRGIVLVPEIALTPQTVARFAARFPHRVAILHSQLSLGEQFDEWRRIRGGEVDVVVGSRSAIFAPQPDLGLIVIDEEHEWTYKQTDTAPRYHAREVAIELAKHTGATVILGSATPDVVSSYRAENGEYHLLQLPERITPRGSTSLPQVEVVDLRDELKSGNRSIFSRSLSRGISEALAAKEQVILFLNRRGTATLVQCRNCGFVLRCRRCEVALTYHSAEEKLVCHQCNYRAPVPHICPQCSSSYIRFLGIGTEKVEEVTKQSFPQARLLRWDRDVTRGRHSHERILEGFLNHEADILIGTQMIAKGLDLPLVTLVGAISADITLHLPDFRAGERSFQLLSQVAGRAGRGLVGGRVVIQTYTPEHYAIQAAAKHDYASFYGQEINYRRRFHNPPFSRLARLVYTHTNALSCQKEAKRLSQLLLEERDSRGIADLALIGPAPSFVPRIRGKFRWQIILRGEDPSQLLSEVPIPQGWVVDIDPVSTL